MYAFLFAVIIGKAWKVKFNSKYRNFKQYRFAFLVNLTNCDKSKQLKNVLQIKDTTFQLFKNDRISTVFWEK